MWYIPRVGGGRFGVVDGRQGCHVVLRRSSTVLDVGKYVGGLARWRNGEHGVLVYLLLLGQGIIIL